MEKIKINQAQEEVFKQYPNKEQLIIARASGLLIQGQDEPIADMKLEDLIKSLYIGYEVEPELSVGDFVVYVHDNTVWEVVGELYGGKVHYDITRNGKHQGSVHKDHIRLATPSEIAQEKERRWWAKIGRNKNEFEMADIVTFEDGNGLFEVVKVYGLHNVSITADFASSEIDVSVNEIKLVCPVENRLDVSVNE